MLMHEDDPEYVHPTTDIFTLQVCLFLLIAKVGEESWALELGYDALKEEAEQVASELDEPGAINSVEEHAKRATSILESSLIRIFQKNNFSFPENYSLRVHVAVPRIVLLLYNFSSISHARKPEH